MGTPTNVNLGAGTLYVAPIGTAEPASATATLDAAFREIGYTENGNTFSYQSNVAAIEAAEEFDPIKYKTTSRVGSVAFNMLETTRKNLALALNMGAAATETGTIEPPDVGDEVRVMILLQTEEGARWLFRQCLQGGNIQVTRNKAPNVAMLPVTFNLEKPAAAKSWIAWPSLSVAGVV